MTGAAAAAGTPTARAEAERVGQAFVARRGILIALILGLVLAVFLMYSLWALWPPAPAVGQRSTIPKSVGITYLGFHFKISSDVLLFLVVAAAGALGGTVHTLRSLSWYVGNRGLKWSWMPFYALLPVVAGSLSTVFYLVIRAGLFSPSTTTQQVSPYGFAALAALVGLFSEQAMQKLRDVSGTLLSPAPKGEDHVEELARPTGPGAGATNTPGHGPR